MPLHKDPVLKLDGKTYPVRFDFNTLADLEEDGLSLMSGEVAQSKLSSPAYLRRLLAVGVGADDAEGRKLAGRIIQTHGLIAVTQTIVDALQVTVSSVMGDDRPQAAQ